MSFFQSLDDNFRLRFLSSIISCLSINKRYQVKRVSKEWKIASELSLKRDNDLKLVKTKWASPPCQDPRHDYSIRWQDGYGGNGGIWPKYFIELDYWFCDIEI